MLESLVASSFDMLARFFSLFLPFVVIFFPIVVVHELGHLLAALRMGVKPEAFAVCFGPKLFSFKYKGINWQLNAIPLGGYVRFAEQGEHDLEKKSYFCRLVVMLAGPLANFVFALLLLCFTFTFLLSIRTSSISDPEPDYATGLGFEQGDKIIKINNQLVGFSCGNYDPEQSSDLWLNNSLNNQDQQINNFLISRDGQLFNLAVAGKANQQLLLKNRTEACWNYNGITRTIPHAVFVWGVYLKGTVLAYGNLINNLFFAQEQPGRLVGIVGISQMSKNALDGARIDFILIFMAAINIALGLFNLLPIPVLDGGKIFYMTAEKFFPALRNEKLKMAIFSATILFLLGLTLGLIFNDFNSPIIGASQMLPLEPELCQITTSDGAECFINLNTTTR